MNDWSKTSLVECGLGGVHSNFFGGYVLQGFSKVGSTEWIFFLKKLGSWEWIFAKISVLGAQILPKLERNGPKNAEFFKKLKKEGIRTDTRCKKVGLRSSGGAWKGGSWKQHIPIYLLHVSNTPRVDFKPDFKWIETTQYECFRAYTF